jgi:hypothetical protein
MLSSISSTNTSAYSGEVLCSTREIRLCTPIMGLP